MKPRQTANTKILPEAFHELWKLAYPLSPDELSILPDNPADAAFMIDQLLPKLERMHEEGILPESLLDITTFNP